MSYTTATSTGIRNVHSRATAGPWSKATTMFDTLSTQDDKLWPADRWPPLELDRGLQVGSRGGHGPVRYHVEAIDPGRSVTFRFDQGSPIVGTHSLTIDPLADGRVSWTHVLEVTRPSPAVTVAILPLHDALLEDLLDQAEAHQAGAPVARRPFGFRVRACLAAERMLEREREPEPELSKRRPVGWAAAGLLAAIGGLHLAWGLGSSWPLSDRVALARTVLGTPGTTRPPGPVACGAVAGALGATSGLVVSRVAPAGRARVPTGVSDLSVRVAGGVLALRASIGFVTSGLGARGVTPEYRRLDLSLYSPLCAVLAFALRNVATGRRGRELP